MTFYGFLEPHVGLTEPHVGLSMYEQKLSLQILICSRVTML